MKYTINVANIGQILSTKKPTEEFNALIYFLKKQLDVSIDVDSYEASGERSERLSVSQNSEASCATSELATDVDDTSSQKSEDVYISSEDEVFPGKKVDFCALIWYADKEYAFDDEEHNEHIIVFTGGDLLKTKSNQGNDWVSCIDRGTFSSGANKKMLPINWVLPIKSNVLSPVKYIPHKYVVHLFHEDQRKGDLKRFLSEHTTISSSDPSTKILFQFEENGQFGFIMRNYGSDLFTIMTNKKISFVDRLKIAMLYVDEVLALFRQGKTHGDLKLENACYHNAYYAKGERTAKEKVTLIDLDGMCSVKKILKIPEEMPPCTTEYLHQFFKNGSNIQSLRFGQYRLIHDLWAMIIACNQLIFESNEFQPFFLERLEKIHELLVWVLENSDKLPQDEMLKFVYKFSLEFSNKLINELNNSIENLPLAEKIEESKPDIIIQGNDETKGSDVECVDKPCRNEKENQASNVHENDGSKKRKRSSVPSFWKDTSYSPNKRQRIEQSEQLSTPSSVSCPG